jgi:hypothetical protein
MGREGSYLQRTIGRDAFCETSDLVMIRKLDSDPSTQRGTTLDVGLSQSGRSMRSKLVQAMFKLQQELRDKSIAVDRLLRCFGQ